MINLLASIVVTLLIVGLLLWAIDAMPWISGDVKRMIHILVIVVAVLWVIQMLFGGIGPLRLK